MKYNRSEIMKAAWNKVRKGWAMRDALRVAWMEAKAPYQRYNVYGVDLFRDNRELIRSGCDDREAQNVRWANQYRYDDIVITLVA